MRHVIFLIDTSYSMHDKIDTILLELNKFINMMKNNNESILLTVAYFNDDIQFFYKVININFINTQLKITDISKYGSTALYDSINKILEEFHSFIGQTFLLIFTDGDDNSSTISKEYIEKGCYIASQNGWKIVHFHPSEINGISSVQNVIYENDDNLEDLFTNLKL